MPCAFHLDRPRPFKDLDPGCQFPEASFPQFAPDLVGVDDKAWCPFHLPMESADGAPSPKADWDKEKVKDFNEAIFAFIDKAKAEDRPADLTGMVFPGYISFERYRDETSALPPVTFFQAQFSDNASFEKAHFSGRAWFREAQFDDDANFDEAQFSGIALFHEARFSGTAGFGRAQFSSDAWFKKAQFGGNADFEKARFDGDAWFNEAQFRGDAWFFGAQFGARAWFDEAQFSDNARFDEARFSGGAFFIEAHFGGYADFREVRFDGDAVFSDATFFENANFEAAIFSNHALFNPAFFKKDANFAGAAEGIGKPKTIQDLRLKTVPAENGSFDTKGTVSEPPRPPGNLFGQADFSKGEFHAGADFNNRRFADETLFRGTKFLKKAPKFHNAILHQDTDFTGADFRDRSGEAAPAYRTLKLAMGQVRAVDEEAMFYALEMECRRKRKDTPLSVKVFSWLYERAADYGRSFMRPFYRLLGFCGVFFLIYLAAFTSNPVPWDIPIPWDIAAGVGRFTVAQVVRPFSAFTLTEGVTVGSESVEVSFGLACLAAIQSVLSLGLIALFILALRRRFRMG